MARLDYQNAQTARDFHHGDDCAHGVTVGPRGGVTYPRVENWRRNGATQTWKRDPERFRVPVKYGLRGYGALTESAAGVWHTGRAEECPDGRLADDIATLAEPCEVCGQSGGRCRFETGCSCWRGIPCGAA